MKQNSKLGELHRLQTSWDEAGATDYKGYEIKNIVFADNYFITGQNDASTIIMLMI